MVQATDFANRDDPAAFGPLNTGGRPPVNAEIKTLVTRMAAANHLWGAPRIHGELLKLGLCSRSGAPRPPSLGERSSPISPRPGLSRLLHRAHRSAPRPLRPRRARSPSPAAPSLATLRTTTRRALT